MEVYRRIVDRLRGALWAHHRRLMPERQYQRILAFVYNNKYEYQLRLDEMTCVGSELGGKVEVAVTPSGHMKRVRVHPDFEDLPEPQQQLLINSAYSKAKEEGHKVMVAAEERVYRQFLRDIQPIVYGIRDNPEFYTVAENAVELPGCVVAAETGQAVHRTIPYEKAFYPSHEFEQRRVAERAFFSSQEGKRYLNTLRGKQYMQLYQPHVSRPKGAPGAKSDVKPFELLAPYTPMDEQRLQRKNWMAYLDNKHVAEVMWTRSRLASRYRRDERLRREGQNWHYNVRPESETRW